MTTDTKAPRTDKPGFSSRWMLDGRGAHQPASVPGDAGASARAIDTDGDGVADTLAVRVDSIERERSFLGRLGTWIARSIVTILLVASLVATGAALANLYQVRIELDRTTALLTQERTSLADAREDAQRSAGQVADLQADAGSSTAATAELEAERDGLALENRVLRDMLVDGEQRTSATR